MEYSYPLLQKVFEHFNKLPHEKVEDCYLVCCQHLLEPQLKMFQYLIRFGFNPEKIIVLGKVYSTNTGILKELDNLGIRTYQPEFLGTSFDKEHEKNCHVISNLIPKNNKIIILDDGGQLIISLSANKNVIFAVEQTSSGFRKLENKKINFPVINVARSNTKLVQESPFIARLCYERIKDYLLDKNIKNPSIIVIGLGPIGTSIQEIFEQNNFNIQGFDNNYGDDNLLRLITNLKPDIIIGATGFSILSKEDIENIINLNKGIYLISVSSSDREFPVAFFRKNKTVHDDVIYKNVTFVNNGFPITFKGNRNEGTPMEMEKTICLLLGSVMFGIVEDIKTNGLINVSKELEIIIN